MPTAKEIEEGVTTRRHSAAEMDAFEAELAQHQSGNKRGLMHGVNLWARPFTHIHHVPVFKRVWLYLAALAVYTIAIDYFAGQNYPAKLFKDSGSAGAFGSVVLGLLLVFRTNSAYERWWEGRKLWGQLTNESRNLCLKVQAYCQLSDREKREFGELIVSFAYALKHHLRGTRPLRPLPAVGLVAEDEHLPQFIAGMIFDRVGAWRTDGKMDAYAFELIDAHCKAFMDICGACERIKSSPIAVSYRAFMRQGIALNLLAWPWYFTHEYSVWWSLPPILIGAYFLIGIELIAEEVEEPFGRDDDDLPLDNICTKIKASVSRIMELQENRKFTVSIEKPRIDILRDGLH